MAAAFPPESGGKDGGAGAYGKSALADAADAGER
jgi:hypothetical protein